MLTQTQCKCQKMAKVQPSAVKATDSIDLIELPPTSCDYLMTTSQFRRQSFV